MIEVTCPECQHAFPVDDAYAGRMITCIRCNAPVEVPLSIVPIHQPTRPQPAPNAIYVRDTKSSPLLIGLLTGCLAIVGLGVVGIAGLFLLGAFAFRQSSSSPSSSGQRTVATNASSSLRAGDRAILSHKGEGGRFFLAIGDSDENWDALIDAENDRDISGVARLIQDGRAFGVQAGAKVRILKIGVVSYKVRIEEERRNGVESMVGKEGWIQREFVRPL